VKILKKGRGIMYILKKGKVEKMDCITFSEIGMKENDIEEILRSNIDIICNDEESMLIVGQQVKNEKNGRSDLTAVDNNGNIVLIEIKRDVKDIEIRKEAFEFQAIRYAASYATIDNPEDLVKKVYGHYIEKYKNEFELGELTSYELGIRKLNEFLKVNEADKSFNEKQRIILVASNFDDQTLSAVAWLNSNQVDMSCFKFTPYRYNEEIYLNTEKILPVNSYDDFYVSLLEKTSSVVEKKSKSRQALPKIDTMLSWGVVKPGDIIVAKGRDDEATLLANGNVIVNGEEKSMQSWLKNVYGWSSVQTYANAIRKESGKTLSQIREEYMEQEAKESAE
jgi:hypothetical protein